MFALKSAICLREKHNSHPKTVPALVSIFNFWIQAEDKVKLLGGDERLVPVVEHEFKEVLQCPTTLEEIKKWANERQGELASEKTGPYASLEFVLEQTKMCKRNNWTVEGAEVFVKALEGSEKQSIRFKTVIAAEKFLQKNGGSSVFADVVRSAYPHATYFKK